MEGRQVQVEAGRNLRLESLQDRETYDSRNT
ncbi:hemagglutinin repeat-containing protein, partial [Acidaminococcus fermentans]